MKSSSRGGESDDLRNRAEKRLHAESPSPEDQSAEAQSQRAVQELQVHQIELEMQNEELRDSRMQLEASLEQYTDLYDFAPVGYFTLSIDGAIRRANLLGARLLGVERARLGGSRLRNFVSECSWPIFDGWFKSVLSSDAGESCELTLKSAGCPPVVVAIEATFSQESKEARAIVINITDRKILEEKLRQVQRLEVVGQLAGGVAHDFNNILGAMILNLEILQAKNPAPLGEESPLRTLEDLAKRAALLTQQLLLFSKRQAMQLQPLELASAVTTLLNILTRVFGDEITLRQLPNQHELWIDGDIGMLDQAITNLCLNARDAMPNGGMLTLEVTLTEFDAESAQAYPESRPGQFVCLKIEDTGCGIDAETLKHVFEPFFTTKEIGKGIGLGLSSAYGIMRQHKGWISIRSIVTKGTTALLYFPRVPKAISDHFATAAIPVPKNNNEQILLVEDEPALLHISNQALTSAGYRVLTAIDGQEALKLWKDHGSTINLVLTDMKMPRGMNGLELAETLWKEKPSLKAIITSGYSMEMVSTGPLNRVGYTFMAKPYSLKCLLRTVRQCLDR